MATNLTNSTHIQFLQAAKSKRVVLFGAGGFVPLAVKSLGDMIDIAYITDNDFWKWGQQLSEYEICSPERLCREASDEIVVLITSVAVFEIEKQLRDMGIGQYFAFTLFMELLQERREQVFLHFNLSGKHARGANYLNIMLVNACNLSCAMCPHYKNSDGQAMSVENYISILDQCENLRIAGKKITGVRIDGNREALLYAELESVLETAKKRNFIVHCCTNGVLLSEDKARMFVEYGINDVNISITGISPKVYMHYQGYGKSADSVAKQLDTVIRNIELLCKIRDMQKSETHISVSFILAEQSVCDARDAVFFWKGIGVDQLFINPDNNPIIESLEKNPKNRVYFSNSVCLSTATVASNGDVFPCCRYGGESMAIGNCFTESLNTIFKSEKYYRLTNALGHFDLQRMPEVCKSCSAIASFRDG